MSATTQPCYAELENNAGPRVVPQSKFKIMSYAELEEELRILREFDERQRARGKENEKK